jgi:hypothetical protein
VCTAVAAAAIAGVSCAGALQGAGDGRNACTELLWVCVGRTQQTSAYVASVLTSHVIEVMSCSVHRMPSVLPALLHVVLSRVQELGVRPAPHAQSLAVQDMSLRDKIRSSHL